MTTTGFAGGCVFLQEKGGETMTTFGKPEIVKNWTGEEQNVYRREQKKGFLQVRMSCKVC